jgi:hypothetical protein
MAGMSPSLHGRYDCEALYEYIHMKVCRGLREVERVCYEQHQLPVSCRHQPPNGMPTGLRPVELITVAATIVFVGCANSAQHPLHNTPLQICQHQVPREYTNYG